MHDDTDLPFGVVRVRANGSDGGHRGVRSVLDAFGTDEIRRVKLGIRPSGEAGPLAERVIAPMEAEIGRRAENACGKAAEILAAMVRGNDTKLRSMGPMEGLEPPTC